MTDKLRVFVPIPSGHKWRLDFKVQRAELKYVSNLTLNYYLIIINAHNLK